MFKANHVRTSPLGLIQGFNFSDDAHFQENTVLGGIHQGRTEMSSNIISKFAYSCNDERPPQVIIWVEYNMLVFAPFKSHLAHLKKKGEQ